MEPTDVHIDAALSNLSIVYRNRGFIADRVLKRVRVKKKSDKYFVWGKNNLRRINSRRAPGAPTKKVARSISDDTYFCNAQALREDIDRETLDNADPAADPAVDTVENLTDLLMLDREVRVAAQLTSTSVITQNTTLSGNSQWSDYTNSTPYTNIRTAKSTVYAASLQKPNTIIIPYDVALVLAQHPDTLDRVKYTREDLLTDGGLPPKIEGLEVLEAGAGENVAQEGQTDSLQAVWSDDVVICYVAPEENLGLKTISVGFTFEWVQRRVRRWWENDPDGQAVVVEENIDEKIVAAVCGYLFKDTLA